MFFSKIGKIRLKNILKIIPDLNPAPCTYIYAGFGI